MTIEQLLCPAVLRWEAEFRKHLNESHIEMSDDDIADEFDKWLNENEDLFIHRAGRTARSGKNGINCVIGDQFEMQLYSRLEKKLKLVVYPKMLYKGKVIDPNSIEEIE